MHIIEVWKSINYKPGIYDPSGIGWTITVAYFLAAFLCLWTGLAEKKLKMINAKPSNYMLWFGLAALMSILGINKQLDLLQTLAVLTIRGIEVDYPLSPWRAIGHVRMKYVVELGGVFMVGAGAHCSRIKLEAQR